MSKPCTTATQRRAVRFARDGVCRPFLLAGLVLLVSLTAGCGTEGEPSDSLPDVLPQAKELTDWTPGEAVAQFDRDNLYDLVDGQADAFFAYGFEQVAVQSYTDAEGAVLDVEVWQLASPSDAYGLFTATRAGAPADIGAAGDSDPGRRLAFWQDRYLVQVRARRPVPDAVLWDVAELVAQALPSGSSDERPALIDRLPPNGLVEGSTLFFHEEISIQDRLWLGGENRLGWGPETDGVLAQYGADTERVQLLLVQYPTASAAEDGRRALGALDNVDLVVADTHENLLGAVFGAIEHNAASALLNEALGTD